MSIPKKHKDLVGTKQKLGGGLFSNKEVESAEYDVLDIRWGSAQIFDMKKMKPKHPTVEYLIKNETMKRSRWTKGFAVREIILKDN